MSAVDKPAESAVERYEAAEVSECRMVIEYGVTATVPVIAKEKADAALAELKAKLAAAETQLSHASEYTYTTNDGEPNWVADYDDIPKEYR